VVLVTVAAVVATTAGFAAQGRASFPGPDSPKRENTRWLPLGDHAGVESLVLLVRARRPIDGWAGPVSGTRLVSVRTAR
jgi:hypothetical protein